MTATTPAFLAADFTQALSPVGGSLAVSALVGTLPLLVVFVLLGVVPVVASWVGALL